MKVPACGTKNQETLHGYPPAQIGSYRLCSRRLAAAAVPLITVQGDFVGMPIGLGRYFEDLL
jgi:hypothetical protein